MSKKQSVKQADRNLIANDILTYLDRYENKDMLRFVTIGSVDDGKSTLIGRLLFDTDCVFEDQLESIRSIDEEGNEVLDLANITDGLMAEREQGITIDVAYRYFSTDKRKFIIADTPGHVQYTRNMATGASTAEVAIILIDARLGVQQQTRRHAFIASLLGIRHLVCAVNKMDLEEFSQQRYDDIVADFNGFVSTLNFVGTHCIPVSALLGDNVVDRSENMDWYTGETILELLENIPLASANKQQDFIFPVQYVLRPDLNFRGFSGTIASGVVKPGDKIKVLPSGKETTIKRIVTMDGDLPEAFAPQSVTLTTSEEVDISRGDVIVHRKSPIQVSRQLEATVVWMADEPLVCNKQYMIKHMTRSTSGVVSVVDSRVDMDTLETVSAKQLELNDIGTVRLTVNRPLPTDLYTNNKDAGSFIIVDRMTNVTVGAGMITGHGDELVGQEAEVLQRSIAPEERSRRYGQKSCVVWVTGRHGVGKMAIAHSLERRLFDTGYNPYVLDLYRLPHVHVPAVGRDLDPILDYIDFCLDMGVITILACTTPRQTDRRRVRAHTHSRISDGAFLEVHMEGSVQYCKQRLISDGRDGSEAEIEYEEPVDCDIHIDADGDLDPRAISKAVDEILALMSVRKLLW